MAILYRAKKNAQFTANTESQTGTGLKRAERMVGILILVYVICWLPFILQWTIKVTTDYFPPTVEGQIKLNRWVRTTVFFCTLNGTINPIIYIFGSTEINSSIKKGYNRSSSVTQSRLRTFDENTTIP